jgi:hypothetical protein
LGREVPGLAQSKLKLLKKVGVAPSSAEGLLLISGSGLLNRNMEVDGNAPAGGPHQLSSGRSSSLGATTGIGAGEKAACSLEIEVGPPDFPVAQGVFEMHGAFPGLGGLGVFAQIGDLGQVEVDQVVDQVCDVGGA